MKKIIDTNRGACPYCGSNNTNYIMAREKDPLRVVFHGHCNSCGKSFREFFKLVYELSAREFRTKYKK